MFGDKSTSIEVKVGLGPTQFLRNTLTTENNKIDVKLHPNEFEVYYPQNSATFDVKASGSGTFDIVYNSRNTIEVSKQKKTRVALFEGQPNILIDYDLESTKTECHSLEARDLIFTSTCHFNGNIKTNSVYTNGFVSVKSAMNAIFPLSLVGV